MHSNKQQRQTHHEVTHSTLMNRRPVRKQTFLKNYMAPRMKHTLDIQSRPLPLPCIVLMERNLMGLFIRSQILFGVQMCVPLPASPFFSRMLGSFFSMSGDLQLGFQVGVWVWGISMASSCREMAGKVARLVVAAGGGWNGEATQVPPTMAVVDCGWTGMEAGESCSQLLPLAAVEGGTSGDADAVGSRRGSGGGGGTEFIKREGGGLHAVVKTEEAWVGIGMITVPFLFVYVTFWTSRISRGHVILVGTETKLHFWIPLLPNMKLVWHNKSWEAYKADMSCRRLGIICQI